MSIFSRIDRTGRTASGYAAGRACAIETLEERRLMAASPLALGLNANGVTNGNYKNLVSLLRDSGTTSVRLWYGFGSYDSRAVSSVAHWVEKFKYDGFDVTLTVNPDNGLVGTPAQTTGLFKFLVSIPGLATAVDRWEIGNEEDSSNYWKGSLKDYVADFLAPASAVLHSVGEKVVSGGVSWNPDDVQRLVDQGMLRYVDYVGYHPYRSSYSDLVAKVAQVKAIAAGKPLVATEWNVRGHESDSSPTAWAADIKKFWPVIRDNFYAAYYYAAIKVNTPAGPAGLINADGTVNDPFYSVFNAFQYTIDTGSNSGGNSSAGSGTSSGAAGGTTAGGGSTTSGPSASTPAGSTGAGTSASSPSSSNSGGSTSSGSSSGSSWSGSKPSGSASGTTTTKPPTKTPAKPSNGISTHTATPQAQVKPKPKPIVPTLTSLALVNADTDRIVACEANLGGTVTIDLSSLSTSNLTFLGVANSKVKSVKWTINGATSVDSSGVFSLFGETRKGGMAGQAFSPGTYVITAQAFGGLNATGTATRVQTFSVNFISTVESPATANAAVMARAAARKQKAQITSAMSRLSGGQLSVLSGVTVVARKKK